MRFSTNSELLLTIVSFTVILTFPLQVISGKYYIAIIPYILMIILFLRPKRIINNRSCTVMQKNIVQGINIYILLIIVHFLISIIIKPYNILASVTSIINYGFPVVFFYYFRNIYGSKQINAILLGIVVASIITGSFFIVDSLNMFGNLQVSEYSIRAFNYSAMRVNSFDINDARISAGYRSHGLLESHTVSAFAISIGCFALLSQIDDKKKTRKNVILSLFFIALLVSMNFTAIMAYFVVVFIMIFHVNKIIKLELKLDSLKLILFFILLTGIGVYFVLRELNTEIVENIIKQYNGQADLATGSREYLENISYFEGFIIALINYPINALNEFPFGILIGEGFSNAYGISKGGDYGFIETLHRFGLLFFIYIFFGIIRLIKYTIKINYLNGLWKDKGYVFFSGAVLFYVLLNEVHYSAWSSKPALPIVFFSIALIYRFEYNFVRSE